MTRNIMFRRLLHPGVIPGAVALLLLGANLVPRIEYGIPVFPSPGSGIRVSCDGVLEFGWPRTARIDQFVQYDSGFGTPLHSSYSFVYLAGKHRIQVHETHWSLRTHIVNAAFVVACVVLAVLGMRVLSERKFSLRSMFAVVTCAGVLVACLKWDGSPVISDPWQFRNWKSIQAGTDSAPTRIWKVMAPRPLSCGRPMASTDVS